MSLPINDMVGTIYKLTGPAPVAGTITGVDAKSVFGVDSQNRIISDVRTINFSKVDNDTEIDDSKWTSLATQIGNEKRRRYNNTYTFGVINLPAPPSGTGSVQLKRFFAGEASPAAARRNDPPTTGISLDSTILASHFNALRDSETGLAGARPEPSVSAPTVVTGDALATSHLNSRRILSSQFNQLIDDLINAGKECVCNANYCTCNCNYCTCNCNYSCTCNCNYSDSRLKTNIIFSHMIDGLNVYKFSYKWNVNKTYLGVMAQQLFGTKYENAVIKDEKGIYMVDYSKLPVEMKEV